MGYELVAMGMMLTGTIMSAEQQKRQGREQKRLYRQRAEVAEESARAVTKATEHKEREKRKEGRRYLARQKVLFAKSGVRTKVGTPLLVTKETEEEFMRDAAFIQEGGAVEAARLRSEAGFERQMGKSAYRAGMWGAGATMMTGLGTAGMYGYQSGMFSRTPKTYGRSGTSIKRRSQWLGPRGTPYRR